PPIYTLSLHDALPIYQKISFKWRVSRGAGTSTQLQANDGALAGRVRGGGRIRVDDQTERGVARIVADQRAKNASGVRLGASARIDRKSTRLNSSHVKI